MASGMFRAGLLGGSGGVGSEILKHLLETPECSKIVLFNRRELELKENEKLSQHIVDMENLEATSLPLLGEVDVVFIAMGVGAPSKTSPENLEKVDVTLPSQFAKAAKAANVQHALLLTSAGANAEAKACRLTGTGAGGGLYLQLKGKVENNLKELGFPSVSLFRPATITGNPNTPNVMNHISPFLDGILPAKYHSIDVGDLAKSMVHQAVQISNHPPASPSVFVFEGRELQELVDSSKTKEG
eukprot:CAMPEP_0201505028 /NCGR_PEP_ID=MMETSP0151_2-20130828/85541_1 /ASSEMBLY_ACC=CAM_ASM_000257 /TAXON_ID=200890 /ORGANISM="Paramoeba atlantica, Strain 621/1 / CCAP 1560/9" /LENGTH=242 /DNA_ID=CAMNT_0047898845 /DNA_START=187 /DNA_END=915 /DNA_ORIENTATION=+